jgi:hypothetical protein
LFVSGKTAGGTAYRREKSAATGAGFGVTVNFMAAVVAEKTRFFAQAVTQADWAEGFAVDTAASFATEESFVAAFDAAPSPAGFLASPVAGEAELVCSVFVSPPFLLPLPTALSVT